MPKLGIVLSGCASKGAYEIGAMQAIVDYFGMESIQCVSSASIGAIIGHGIGMGRVPELEMAFVYAAFGWYPILRPKLNRLPGFLIQLVTKALLGGGLILLLYGVLLRFFGMTGDLQDAVQAFRILLLILGVITFLTIDVALEHFTLLWHNRFRKQFFKH